MPETEMKKTEYAYTSLDGNKKTLEELTKIGGGESGVVYKVRDVINGAESDKFYALKKKIDKEDKNSFTADAQKGIQLKGRFYVEIESIGHVEGENGVKTPAVLMEYWGDSLRKILPYLGVDCATGERIEDQDKIKLSDDLWNAFAYKVLWQSLQSIKEAHGRGGKDFSIGDIKPSHFLLEEELSVFQRDPRKLVDCTVKLTDALAGAGSEASRTIGTGGTLRGLFIDNVLLAAGRINSTEADIYAFLALWSIMENKHIYTSAETFAKEVLRLDLGVKGQPSGSFSRQYPEIGLLESRLKEKIKSKSLIFFQDMVLRPQDKFRRDYGDVSKTFSTLTNFENMYEDFKRLRESATGKNQKELENELQAVLCRETQKLKEEITQKSAKKSPLEGQIKTTKESLKKLEEQQSGIEKKLQESVPTISHAIHQKEYDSLDSEAQSFNANIAEYIQKGRTINEQNKELEKLNTSVDGLRLAADFEAVAYIRNIHKEIWKDDNAQLKILLGSLPAISVKTGSAASPTAKPATT